MHDIILIERYPPPSIFWPNLVKDSRIPELSVGEILNKYRGFEGDLIAIFRLKKDESETDVIFHILTEGKVSKNHIILHVISDPDVMPFSLKEQVFLVGYDIGLCEEEAIYSSIFHEILFGHLDELVAFKDTLNENFLFGNKSLAEEYVKLHNELSKQGKDVEDYMEMIIYEIWEHKT